ncbi:MULTISPECIES: family 43 glycosylhydrolase [Kitasatospora]|uniref:Putative xylanase n=1 Tax=Kitasatospora setae (strain ATCC 33774 / DSM 43861 / JCM 3304 / KCC A-0304 / NBRC 14216 / KM-6054) TaxID=452652 RepID=E4NJJ4_KITSK|nr:MULTISPECIES: family 43 glycosylhydrolase [Kitasatospora]BAJ33142.1 putative xylanase [Kitasatospora setae KM-6054]
MDRRWFGAARRRTAAVAAATALLAPALAVAAAPARAAAAPEIIVNGGFENGLAGWSANHGNPTDGAVLSSTADAHSGAAAVLVTGRTTTGSGPMQDLSGKVRAGRSYTVTARVKYDDPAAPAAKQFFATMHYGGATYTNLGTVTVPRGQWGLLRGTFTVPAGQDVGTARLFLETPWVQDPASAPHANLMDFEADDVSLTEADPAPTRPPGHAAPAKTVGNANPLIDYQYGADPWAMVYDGRVYEYLTSDGSTYDAAGDVVQAYEHDAAGAVKDNGYGQIRTLTVLSSADLVNWTNEGQVKVAGAPGAAPWAANSWAPAAAHKPVGGKEKFFLYFANSGGGIGVLTADSPTGPWTDPIGGPLVSPATPGTAGVVWMFDPAVLVDDDGSAYLYFGGGVPAGGTDHPRSTRVIRLGDDMVSTVGQAVTIDAPAVFEDSGINKINGKYYYSYCTNFSHSSTIDGQDIGYGNIAYMVSDSPTGPFRYQGQILANPGSFFGAGGNNHHAMFEFKGRTYITYHTQTLQSALVAGGSLDQPRGYRSTHIDQVTVNPDGTIAPITGTYRGPSRQGTLDAHRRIEAETIAWDSGIQDAYDPASGIRVLPVGAASDGEQKLADLDDGEWTALAGVDFGQDGATSLAADVLPKAGSRIEVRLDHPDATGTPVGTLTVPAGSGRTWTEVRADLTTRVTGTHDVFLTARGPGPGELFDVDDWRFGFDRTAPAVTARTTPAAPDGPDGWFTGPVTVELSATDDSGVAGVEYRLGDGSWQPYTAPVALPEGSTALGYRATDTAGNTSAEARLPVKRDSTAPTVAARLSAPTLGGLYEGSATLTLTGEDTGSGLGALEYALDGGDWHPYTAPVTVDAPGRHTVTHRATDRAGNRGATGTATVDVVPACTRTVTGHGRAALVVTAGTTCLKGAEVGTVTVVDDTAVLVVVDSRILGNLNVHRGTAVVAENSTFEGNATLSGTTGRIGLTGNAFARTLNLTGNTGSAPLLSGNRVEDALGCAGNDPAPVDGGTPNRTARAATGQCAALAVTDRP